MSYAAVQESNQKSIACCQYERLRMTRTVKIKKTSSTQYRIGSRHASGEEPRSGRDADVAMFRGVKLETVTRESRWDVFQIGKGTSH